MSASSSSRCRSPRLCSQTATYCFLHKCNHRLGGKSSGTKRELCQKMCVKSSSFHNITTEYSPYHFVVISHTFQTFLPNQTISTGWPLLLYEWERDGGGGHITLLFHQCQTETETQQFDDILMYVAIEFPYIEQRLLCGSQRKCMLTIYIKYHGIYFHNLAYLKEIF